MTDLMLGNLISLGASVFLAASCCAKREKRAYLLQAAESGTLCCSYLVFAAWAGLSTQALSVARNLLVVRGRYNARWMVCFTVLAAVLGLAVNDRGLLGLLPVAATVQLTLCSHFCRGIRQVKVSFLVNAVQWLVFSFSIGDVVNGCTQILIILLCAVSLFRLGREEKAGVPAAG